MNAQMQPQPAVVSLPITMIKMGRNPRTSFPADSLRELSATIKEFGVIQPITVEPDGADYVLVAGERRLRASEMAGLTHIPAIVRERSNHNGRERLLMALVENVAREDMNPIDLADSYLGLMDEFGMSVTEISKKIGKSTTQIYNTLELTKLDEPIKDLIRRGWWKTPELTKSLMAIEDVETRIGLAQRLHANRTSLKGCVKAIKRVLDDQGKKRRKSGRPTLKIPALSLAVDIVDLVDQVTEKKAPPRWDMLRQLGTVPQWEAVVQSALETCDGCALRNIAGPSTCRDCGAVHLLRLLMARSK